MPQSSSSKSESNLSNDGGDLVKADVNSSSLPLHSLPAAALLGLLPQLDADEGVRRRLGSRAVVAGPGDVGVMA
jgi:hypothetical protein